MAESLETELDKLRKALAGLEAQRAVLDEAIVAPALDSLREKIAALEAQVSVLPSASEERRTKERRSEERRIATVLFTDIVGSTALAEKLDPEDWREVVAAVHGMAGPLVQKHAGSVLQYLGDGL